MSERCTPEQKQHMLDLVQEVKEYADQLPKTIQMPMSYRLKIHRRMKDIHKEMLEFRRMYPDD